VTFGRVFSIFLFLTGAVAVAQNDRDFNGTWVLNPSKSEMRRLPEPAVGTFKVEQQGALIRCVSVGSPVRQWSYSTDGKSVRQSAGGVSTNSATKWEGAALLINTIVDGPQGNYTVMDRWRLSRNNNLLTIDRQVVRREGEDDSTLVYERAGTAAEPVLVTRSAEPAPSAPAEARREPDYLIAKGTRIPLVLLTPVSSKKSREGDRVYLDTVAPVVFRGRVVIPAGSHVIGELREVKQADRARGKSALMIVFDSISLPTGVTRDFHSRMSGSDAQAPGTFDREEGRIEGDGRRATDARRTAQGGIAGGSIGAIAGGATGHLGMGAGIGAGVGAAAGLAGTLLGRGPDVVLPKGSTIEMTLDRDLGFSAQELSYIR
jgi:hypothetical protein